MSCLIGCSHIGRARNNKPVLRNYEFLIHFAGTFHSSSGESLVPICYALVDCLQCPAWPFPARMSYHTLGAAICPSLASACRSAVEKCSSKLVCMPCIRTIRWPNGASSDQSRGRRDIEALRIDGDIMHPWSILFDISSIKRLGRNRGTEDYIRRR